MIFSGLLLAVLVLVPIFTGAKASFIIPGVILFFVCSMIFCVSYAQIAQKREVSYLYQRETELGKILARENLELAAKRARVQVGSLGAYLILTSWENSEDDNQLGGINATSTLDQDLRAIMALIMGVRNPRLDNGGLRTVLLQLQGQ